MKLVPNRGRTRRLQPWILAALAASILVTFGGTSAKSQTKTAAQSAPANSPDAHLGRAYDALRDDRYEVAAAEFRAALKIDPKLTLRARFPLAVALFEMKKPEEARQEFEAVQYQLGLLYRKQGREQQAIQAMALSGEQRQRDSSQSQLRLECAQKLDQAPREEAHAVCEQLYDPDDAEKLTELGTIYGQHGDVEAALKPLRRAAELAPQSPQMQYNLALAHYQLNQFEEARTPLSNAVTRWPDIFQLAALYGAVLSKLGEDLPAYQALRHAHELNAQDSATADLLYLTTLALARKAQSARQYPEALRYFHEAAKLKAQEPAPHRGLADVYNLTGRPAQAITEQQEADRLASAFEKTQ